MPKQKEKAAKYAEIQVGNKPYPDISFMLDSKHNTNQFYCSSLIWRAWKETGFDIDYDNGKNRTTGKLLKILQQFRDS